MKKRTMKLAALMAIMASPLAYQAQQMPKENPDNWFTMDTEKDGVKGVGADRAYDELLKDKKSTTIIVAVVDSGVDRDHEDLQGKIWVNEDEIPDNGIDDDNNGYIDDVNGWSFIGGEGGDVGDDTMEITRIIKADAAKYADMDVESLKGQDKKDYEEFQKRSADYIMMLAGAKAGLAQMTSIKERVETAMEKMKTLTGKDDFTLEDVQAYEAKNDEEKGYKQMAMGQLSADILSQLEGGFDYYGGQVNSMLNLDFDTRADLVGDNYSDVYEKSYGNNHVDGPHGEHGTHVAGIIAANRNNNLGIKGIAEDVKIMCIRTVPNGDERDKDVANSIYYAVDNGAKVINMSFGKGYSPYEDAVNKAFRYAESKGVIVVHAAGNDSKDNDAKPSYPSKYYKDGKTCSTWIEVGASSSSMESGDFVGSFSNYGKKTVDIFAPGVAVHSTVPGNQYDTYNGTSMASPAVAGVVAMLWSYYPDYSAEEIIKIIKKSSTKYKKMMVAIPGGEEEVKFGKLSNTAGVINVYEAIKLAEEMKK